MKKAIKTLSAAVAIAATFSACSGNGNTDTADSSKVDSTTSVKTTTDTTVHADTMVARDTNTLMADTATTPAQANRVDTLKKTVTKTTVVKKQVTKKP